MVIYVIIMTIVLFIGDFILVSKSHGDEIQIIKLSSVLFSQISAVEVVCTSRGDSVPGWALCEQLRYFCGVVAVGTICGYVYFLGKN